MAQKNLLHGQTLDAAGRGPTQKLVGRSQMRTLQPLNVQPQNTTRRECLLIFFTPAGLNRVPCGVCSVENSRFRSGCRGVGRT